MNTLRHGEGHIDERGYIRRGAGVGGKYRYLHRIIVELNIGRKLAPDEIVHHRDGNKLNNDINNLEITSRSLHKKHHDSIGEKTRFKRVYTFNKQLVVGLYQLLGSFQSVADTLGCSQKTVERIIKSNHKSYV